MKLLCLISVVLSCSSSGPVVLGLQFDTTAPRENNFKGGILNFKDRMYVPYGPDLTTSPIQADQPWTGYGYGMGATEHIAYDYVEKYIYSQSEAGGFITTIDYSELPGTVTEFSIDVGGRNVDVKDIVVCPQEGLLFVTISDTSKVHIYETVKRSGPKIPELVAEVDAGNAPDAMKLSNDCKTLAVANQNEGPAVDTSIGSLTLVSDFRNDPPTTRTVSLEGFDDDYLFDNGVHMPLSQKALQYWNTELTLGYEALVNDWNPALALDPEFIAFNNDGTEIFLNLQENSAVARINVATATATAIKGYGLKDMRTSNIDIVDDEECNFVQSPCLYLSRSADGIATVEIDGTDYILLAEEGSDFDLNDDFGEKFDSEDLLLANSTFAYSGFTFGPGIEECAVNFAADCEAKGLEWCSNFEMTIGTAGVNYDDTSAPILEKIVGIGGRGMSIFRVPSSTSADLELVWESGSDFEEETCDKFPWANNAVMDEDFAPLCSDGPGEQCARYTIFNNDDDRGNIEERSSELDDGCDLGGGVFGACPMSKTVDEKAQEDGLAVEAVVVGVACDHLVAVACGENNGVCLLYDITDVSSPKRLKTFHLSPANENKNPDQSYRVDMGDLDSETILFLSPEKSPTGHSGILFAGAISGTLSFYEFECVNPDTGDEDIISSSSGLSGGAIAGIVIGGIVGAVLIVLLFVMLRSGSKKADGVETAGDSGNYA